MTKVKESDSQIIAEWLGKCWHDDKASNGNVMWEGAVCSKCGTEFPKNPDYFNSPHSSMELIKALTSRPDDDTLASFWVRIEFDAALDSWYAKLGNYITLKEGEAVGSSMQSALASAVLNYINNGNFL